jgi:hypothetical protein
MRTTVLPACLLVALVTTGAAQGPTKLAGKMECAKPDPSHVLPVADAAKHALSLSADKCTWLEGTLGAERLKDEDDTIVSDATGNISHDRGYGVGSVGNGDKYFIHFEGTTALKNDAPVSGDCTWKFTGGTGKLKGITGKGTCKGTFQPDGRAAWDIKGEYQLATAAGK